MLGVASAISRFGWLADAMTSDDKTYLKGVWIHCGHKKIFSCQHKLNMGT